MNKQYSNSELKNIIKNLTLVYIEDETSIRENLLSTLEILFKKVDAFEDANDALKYFRDNHVDMVLSDINLPTISGLEFAEQIRKKNHQIPIILLTAHTDKEYLLQATKLKLINYLTKPVSFDELLEALLEATRDIVRNGNYKVLFQENISYDVINQVLYKNEVQIDLSTLERKLLNLLCENKNNTVTIQQIKNHVWEDEEKATESALKSLLNKFRKKIGVNSLKSISGVGYQLITQ